MTLPLAGDRTLYEPGTLGAATLRSRRRSPQSLVIGRLHRGVKRQLPLALLVAFLITAAGMAYDISGGLSALTAALFWAPLGVATGIGVGLVRELGRNTVTSLSSFGKRRGYPVLGAAPELTERTLLQLPPDRRTPLGCIVFQPASPFATSFRDLQSVIGEHGVVAFIAALPNEGATTATLCAGASAAMQGRRTIIVDCDIRRRSLTRELGADPTEGVIQACNAPSEWRRFVEEEEESGVHYLAAARMQTPWRSLVGAEGLLQLIAGLRQHYDLVLLDCPPAIGSEGSMIAGLADRTVLVTAWDRTPLNAVRAAMRTLTHRARKGGVAGVYVNRVPQGYRFGRLRGD